jgi:hypothetical protein
MSVTERNKETSKGQAKMLNDHAILIDQYNSNGKKVYVYYINGFYIEAISDVGIVIDVMPYLKGRDHEDIRLQRAAEQGKSSAKQ